MGKKHSDVWGMGGRGQSREREQGMRNSKGRMSPGYPRKAQRQARCFTPGTRPSGAEARGAPQVRASCVYITSSWPDTVTDDLKTSIRGTKPSG